MEESEGFEPSELLHPLVFKTSVFNQTLPTLQNVLMEERTRFELVELLHPLAFQASTINPTLSPFQMVARGGIRTHDLQLMRLAS
jgi:hypothetical protein